MFGGWTFKCISADLSLTDHPKIKLSEFDAFLFAWTGKYIVIEIYP